MKTLLYITIVSLTSAIGQAEWRSTRYPGMTESHPVPMEVQQVPLTPKEKIEADRLFWELVDAVPDQTFEPLLCDMLSSGNIVLTFENYAQSIGGYATTHTCLDPSLGKFIFDVPLSFLARPNLSREDKIVILYHEFQHLRELWTGEGTAYEYQWPAPPDRWIADLWNFNKRNFFSELSAYTAECRLAKSQGWHVTQAVCQGYEEHGIRGIAFYLADSQFKRNSYGPNARFMDEWIDEFILTRASPEELAHDRRRIAEEQARGTYAAITPAQYDEVLTKLRTLTSKHPKPEVQEILRVFDQKLAVLSCRQKVEQGDVRLGGTGFSLFVTPDGHSYPLFWFGYPFMTDPQVSDEERMLAMWHEYQHLLELTQQVPEVDRWNPHASLTDEERVVMTYRSELKASRTECGLAEERGWQSKRCTELGPLGQNFSVRVAERMAGFPEYSKFGAKLAELAALQR